MKLPGTLTISDGGEIRLEVLGLFEDIPSALHKQDAEIPRIIGDVEKFGFVTLDDCFYTSRTISFPSPAKNHVHVSRAFLKVAYEPTEAVAFTSFYFSIEGLDEWHALTGIQVAYDPPTNGATVTFSPPPEIELWNGSGVTIRICFSWSLPSMPARTNATLSQKSYLRIEYDQPTTLEEFTTLAHKLIHFFNLAVDKAVAIQELTARSPSIVQEFMPGTTRQVDIPIYYRSLSFSKIAPTISEFDMLFQLGDLGGNQQMAITRFLKTHEKVGPGMNLYFSAIGDEHKYLNSRFLLLAQALETYHRRTTAETELVDGEFRLLRWAVVDATPPAYRPFIQGKLAYANEVTLRTRMTRLLARFPTYFGTDDDRQKFIQSIVRTRNYFTHYDASLEEKAADGIELWNLCVSMRGLFQLILLAEIGFSEAQILKAVTKSYRLKRATKPK